MRKILFTEKNFSQSFSNVDPTKFRPFCWNEFGGFVRTIVNLHRNKLTRTKFFKRLLDLTRFSDIEHNVCALSFNLFSAGSSKLPSLCPQDVPEVKTSNQKIYNFLSLSRTLSEKAFVLLAKTFRQSCQDCFEPERVNEKFSRKKIFESILFSSTFSDIERNVLAFCHKVFGMVVKSAFFVSNDHPKDKQLFPRK